jgi:hypothetical protein
MGHPRVSNEEIDRRGWEIYRKLLPQIETDENVGKIISIDVETGEYAIDDDTLSASGRLLARRPDAALFGMRIGYDAVYALGGVHRGPQANDRLIRRVHDPLLRRRKHGGVLVTLPRERLEPFQDGSAGGPPPDYHRSSRSPFLFRPVTGR